MITQLAQSLTVSDTMISGKWLLDAIPVLSAAAVVIIGKNHWKNQAVREQATNDVTIKKPVPTIETREKPVWASKADLDTLASRHDLNIRNVHHRLDDQVKALSRLEGTATATNDTVGKLLDIALSKKPSPRA